MSDEKNIPLNKDLAKRFPEDRHASKTQQTNTMEVHHHGHVHEKKKWKEYLFHFLRYGGYSSCFVFQRRFFEQQIF